MLTAVVTVLVPEVSRRYAGGDLAAVGSLWRGAVGGLALVILPLFCFLFVFADDIIALYVPASYGQSEHIFRIFLLALPLRCAVYNPLLVGMGKARWAVWASLGDLVTNLGMSVLFVVALRVHAPDLALLGPAAATVMATYLQVFALLFLIARHLRWSLAQLLPWARLLRTVCISAAAALTAVASSHLVAGPAASLMAGAMTFAAAIGGALLLLPEDRLAVRRVVRR